MSQVDVAFKCTFSFPTQNMFRQFRMIGQSGMLKVVAPRAKTLHVTRHVLFNNVEDIITIYNFKTKRPTNSFTSHLN